MDNRQRMRLRDAAGDVALVQIDALRELGEIGTAEAYHAIRRMLESGHFRTLSESAANRAMKAIASRLGGPPPAPVAPPRDQPPASPANPFAPVPEPTPELPPPPPDFQARIESATRHDHRFHVEKSLPERRAALLEESLRGIEKEVRPRRFGYTLTLQLVGGRHQKVHIAYERAKSDPMILIYTRCGPVSDDVKLLRWVLQLNLRMPHGAIAIGRDGDQDCFVLIQTLLEATADPDEVRKAVLTVAEKGDHLEKILTDEDRY